MYFEANQVNNILVCQQCQGKLEGPKILPCGETICSFCVSSIQTNLNVFNCLVCKQQHEMPKNGLPDNKIALKMLSVKPIKVFRGEAVDLLEKKLEEILKKHKLIKHSIENSTDLVKEHCIDLRSDVQLKTEEAIQQINDLSSKIIEEIDEYEEELIELNNTNSKSLDKLNKLALELESFHDLNTEYLKQNTINEQILKKSIEEATNLIIKSELEIQKLKDIIFDGKLLIFEKNFNKINKSILGEACLINTNYDSIILSGLDQKTDLIKLCDIPITKKWKLIYRGSKDGFEASSFHLKCDKQPNTLIIIKSEHGNVFGGYTEQDWTSTESSKTDNNSFIFSLINKDNKPLKLKCLDALKAICCSFDHGPIFGLGPGIRIDDNSNQNQVSLSNLGITSCVYKHPYYPDNSLEAKSFLAGSRLFKVLEIEAYTLREYNLF
jgi:hypothetical protein